MPLQNHISYQQDHSVNLTSAWVVQETMKTQTRAISKWHTFIAHYVTFLLEALGIPSICVYLLASFSDYDLLLPHRKTENPWMSEHCSFSSQLQRPSACVGKWIQLIIIEEKKWTKGKKYHCTKMAEVIPINCTILLKQYLLIIVFQRFKLFLLVAKYIEHRYTIIRIFK